MNEDNNKIGLFACICVLIGGCIGSAIYSLSGMTIYYAGASSLITWIIAALIQGSYGIQVAELSCRYPLSGGVYVFPSKAINRFTGFISAWGYIVTNFIAVAFAAIYVGRYLGASFPLIKNYSVIIGIITIAFCLMLNMAKVTNLGKLNVIFVAFLVVTMLVYSFTSITHTNFNLANFTPFFMGTKGKFGFLQAVPNAMVGYGSVVSIAFMVGKVKKPNKNVPLSMTIALFIVMILYVLMIFATLGHITYTYLEANEGLRFIPLFAAAWKSMMNITWLSKLISISAFFALITTILIVQYLTAVAIKATADDGLLPKFFALSNKNEAPIVGLCTTAFIAIILSLKPAYTEILVNLASLTAAVTIVIVIVSLIVSRKKYEYKEGYKAPGGNILSYITIALIVISYIPSIINGDFKMWAFTIGLYLLGVCIYEAETFYNRKKTKVLYTVSGAVIHGKGMGRTVGMPTANIDYKKPLDLPFGVYSTIIQIDNEKFLSVTNVGEKPTVDDTKAVTVETHIIDFDRDIYDKVVIVYFYKFIRDIKKFESLKDVKEQVDKDIEFTKKNII